MGCQPANPIRDSGTMPHTKSECTGAICSFQPSRTESLANRGRPCTVIGEHVPKKNSPLSFCPTFTLSGAYRTPPDADTAFGGSRSAGYVFNIQAATATPDLYDAGRAWVRDFWDAMRPHAMDSGGYVNFMVEANDDRVRASYGSSKYERLARVKSEYDPENLFHLNANIKPAPQVL